MTSAKFVKQGGVLAVVSLAAGLFVCAPALAYAADDAVAAGSQEMVVAAAETTAGGAANGEQDAALAGAFASIDQDKAANPGVADTNSAVGGNITTGATGTDEVEAPQPGATEAETPDAGAHGAVMPEPGAANGEEGDAAGDNADDANLGKGDADGNTDGAKNTEGSNSATEPTAGGKVALDANETAGDGNENGEGNEGDPSDPTDPADPTEPDNPSEPETPYTGEKYDGKYWYYYKDGQLVKNDFVNMADKTNARGNKWCYYDSEGRMLYGEQYLNNSWYLFNEYTGAVTYDFQYLTKGKKWVYYDTITGIMAHGEGYVNKGWYLFNEYTGAVSYKFQYLDKGKKWVYYDPITGRMHYGQDYINKGWYYLTPNTGAVDYEWAWLPDNKKWVYYDSVTGRMKYGWQKIDGEKYWFDKVTGQSDYAQYLRWMLHAASGKAGINFFNGATCSSSALAQLEKVANSIYARGYSLGYVIMDLATGKGVSCNIDHAFYSASTIKAPYIMSVITNVFGSNAGKASGSYSRISSTLTWSSNEDYASLRNSFGSAPFSTFCTAAGTSGSISGSHYTWYSARDLAKLWLQMYSDYNKGSGGSMVKSLNSQSSHSAIRNAVGSKYTVCSKPGWYTGGHLSATNDAGIVYSKSGAYVCVVMSNMPDDVSSLTKVASALDKVHSSIMK